MINVERIRKTCMACPAQWQGTLNDGQTIYVRYRWGHLRISVGETLDEAIAAPMPAFDLDYGNFLDGYMNYDELKDLTKGKFIWPAKDNYEE